jgi:hypothetical protein
MSSAIKEEKLKNLSFLIMKLDEFRAFRRSNPEYLRAPSVKCGVSHIFERIKPDLETIANFPETLPDVLKLIRVVVVLRKLLPLCIFSMVLALLIRAGVFKVLNPILFYIMLILPMSIMFLFIVVDQVVRRKIARAENNNPELHTKEKENIKQAINEITRRVSQDISVDRGEAEKYKMKLYFDDYKGVIANKEYRERVMIFVKKKYSRFLSTFKI